ncbi:MAG: UbiD family decarboxylase [Pseudomonadota bacterium]
MPNENLSSRVNNGVDVVAPIRTLREWLRRLETSGRVAKTRPGIPLQFTLAALAKRLDGQKATVFPSPGDHPLTVVSGLVSQRSWIAEVLGVSEAEVVQAYRDAVDNPVPWIECDSDAAPVHQHIRQEVDLTRDLPIPTHNEHDNGAYITAGLVIAANPKTGHQNVSINRLQVSGANRLGVLILPRDLHRFFDAAESEGEALDVAIAIGVDPLTLLASQAILPIDHDELMVAGALHGEPLRVVKCATNGVRVPADAEIVLEGRILPNAREMEGPFGEFPQYYGPAGKRQVIEIDAITHRDAPLYHTIVPAAMEHLLLGAIPREASLLAHLQRTSPGVVDVHLSRGGVCRYHLWVKLRKRWEGEPKNVIASAFAGHADIKQVIVVDDDVDIHDPVSVEWAVATRFQASQDLVVMAGALGSRLDPSSDDGIVDKVGFDATKPVAADPFRFTVVHVPGEDDADVEGWLE